MTSHTRPLAYGAAVVGAALVLAGCGASAPPAPAAASPSATTSSSSPAAAASSTTGSVTAVQPGTPTQVVDRFLTAAKDFDCATAFAYLAGSLRKDAGSATALCAALHKDPVVSFVPSTLIHQGSSYSLVQVQVSCGDGSSDYYIASIIPTPGLDSLRDSSARPAASVCMRYPP